MPHMPLNPNAPKAARRFASGRVYRKGTKASSGSPPESNALARACRKQQRVVSDRIHGFTLRQLPQQRLGFLQIDRVKAFPEPMIDVRHQLVSFCAPGLLLPQPAKARGRP